MKNLLGPVGQLGYVVEDLEKAAWLWVEKMGVGPWTVIPHVTLDYFNYLGESSDVEMGIAMAFTGSMQIELIQQHNRAPSMYRDFINECGEGIQHVCFYPRDYDAALESLIRKGMNVRQDGAIRGMRFAYLEGTDGNVLEIGDIPENVRLRRQDDIASAACWNGSDPVRVFE